MRMRALGKTGLQVSELSLGTWGLSGDGYGPVAESDQREVIDRALALGITLFETADSYAKGAMESRLGEQLAGTAAMIVTKIGTNRVEKPARKQFDAAYVRSAVEGSRARLRREAIDVVLLHNPAEATLTGGEATSELEKLRVAGTLRAWGVSAGTVQVARAAIAEGAAVVSVAHNALFSKDLSDLHEDVVKSGVGVLAHSVLAYGLLTGYWSMHKEFAPGDHRADRWTPEELRRRVSQQGPLRTLVGGDIYTQRAAALRYVLASEDVSSMILGPKSVVQLDQLVRESGKAPPYLTKEQRESLDFRLETLGVEK